MELLNPLKFPSTYAVEPSAAEPEANRAGYRATFYPALDGYRALAVLMVFSVHYLATQLPVFHNWGYMGVDFFFVLSGFLITGILYDSRNRPHRMRDFYARRMLRIFPLYYGLALALLLTWPLFHWHFQAGMWLWVGHLGNWARYIFYRADTPFYLDILRATRHTEWLGHLYFGHFWSLCVEEQFYLFWPLVVFAARSRRRLMAFSSAVVVAEPIVRAILWYRIPSWLIQNDLLLRGTVFRLDALLIGGLIALALRGPQRELLHRYGRLVSVALALPLIVFLYVYCSRHGAHVRTAFMSPVRMWVTAGPLFGAALLLELIRSGSPVARLFSWRPLARLGQISYGFYVFHDLFHDVYNDLAIRVFHTVLSV